MSTYDAGGVPDDPGDLGIEALFAPQVPTEPAENPGPPAAAADGAGTSDHPETEAAADSEGTESAQDAAAAASDAPAADGAKPGTGTGTGTGTDGSAWAFVPGAAEATAGEPEPGAQGPPGAPGPPGAEGPPAEGAVAEPESSPRERLRDFALDSRMRIWRRRILLTVIAGGVFSIIFTWRLGLTIAVLVAIADTVWRSRTMASVPPGVKVTRTQRRTQRQLSRLERSGYRALHSRPIPGSKEFIDHLVVGPTGVYAIDSEKWDRRLPIRTRNARQLWHGPESKKDRLEHAKWEAERASTLLSGNLRTEVIVRPSMAVYGPKIPWDIATIRDVDVFKGSRVKKYMRKRGKQSPERLKDAEIDKIYHAAMTVLPY